MARQGKETRAEREARLAAALRANLRRRKAQMRARGAGGTAGTTPEDATARRHERGRAAPGADAGRKNEDS